MPLVSVVIPHFNRAALLHITLASLQTQDINDWEAIVVDDGSSPDEWALAQEFQDSRITFLQRTDGNKGPSRCRNLGTQAANSEHVIFVDSDDIVAPWALRQRLTILGDHPDVDFAVFPVMLFANTPGDQNLLWNTLEGNDDVRRFLSSDPVWHTSSPIWRKDALVQLDGFNEHVMYGDDSDLHLRALLKGLRYTKQPCVLPDMFVRRSDDERITNTLSPKLIESRRTRLKEGSKVLNRHENLTWQRIWEGQYFFEVEFLLFNCDESRADQKKVIAEWENAHLPSPVRKLIVKTYLSVANATRRRGYLVLRLSRRVSKLLLPACFFAVPGGFESTSLPNDVFERVNHELERTPIRLQTPASTRSGN